MSRRHLRPLAGLFVLALLTLTPPTAVAAPLSAATGIVISEVMYNPDPDGPQAGCEWVELHNRGHEAVSLAGWSIVISSSPSHQYALGGEVAGGGYLVVTGCAAMADACPDCAIHLVPEGTLGAKGLRDAGDGISLASPSLPLADMMSYGDDTSFCPRPASAPQGQSLHLQRLDTAPGSCDFAAGPPTPGQMPPPPQATPTPTPSPTTTATATTTPTATPTVPAGALLLTEVYYQGGCALEWVEMANRSGGAVSLHGWTLRDNYGSVTLAGEFGPGALLLVHGAGATPAAACPATALAAAGPCLGNGLADAGDRLELRDATGRLIDAMSYGDDGRYGAVPPAPALMSLARFAEAEGALGGWEPSEPGAGCLQPRPPAPTATVSPTATPAPAGATPTVTPVPAATVSPQDDATPTPTPPPRLLLMAHVGQRTRTEDPGGLLISEVLYDGATADEGDEFVELRNYTNVPISLAGHKLGDAERPGDGEGMYLFPDDAAVPAGGVVVAARCAASFAQRFGRLPDFEFRPGACPDSPSVPDLARYTAWGRGSFNLANTGDEVLLLAADDTVVDAVAFGAGDFGAVGLAGDARAAEPLSLHRVAALDCDDMSLDFSREAPSPGVGLDLPLPAIPADSPTWGPLRAYWGNLHAHTSSSDGAGPAELALARARAAGLHFYALTDHDHSIRPEEWWRAISAVNAGTAPGAFVALIGFEWTHRTQGHVNVLAGHELVTRDGAGTSDLQGLYLWLEQRSLALAQFNHPGRGGPVGSATAAGEGGGPVRLQEVMGGDGTGGYASFEAELLLAWRNGWRVAPTFGADTHRADWGSDTAGRTGVWAESLTPDALLEGLLAGRVFATADANAAAGWRCGAVWMGAAAAVAAGSDCALFYHDGDGEPAQASLLDFDGHPLVQWTVSPGEEVGFGWPAGQRALWVSLRQADGDRVWTAPIWSTAAP